MNKHSFVWALPSEGKSKGGIDVSSYGNKAYKKLSPFSYHTDYNIPVPGREYQRAHSVEGIWQGLKIIDGKIDESLFTGKPNKRRKQPEGHMFGNPLFGQDVLGYASARQQIYVPAYIYHAVNNALDDVKDDLEKRLETGPDIMYDVESNGQIKDVSKPYSHAALLVDVINLLKDAPLPPFNKTRFADLDDQVDAAVAYREQLQDKKLNLFDNVITFAYLFSPDELKQTFALRAMNRGAIPDYGRLKQYRPTAKTEQPYSALC